MYYFLLSVFNLIETHKDESPIIDTKGTIQGKCNYSVTLEAFDVDRSTKLNLLEYENLNDLIGKNLQLCIELKKVSDIPEKLTFQTQCKYVWQDENFETRPIAGKKAPEFGYKGKHMILVNDDMI